MTDREKAIVMAHTGICMLTGDKFQIFHKYVEDIMGRPIMTHEIGWLADAIKEKSKADFLALCADESGSEKPQKWIPIKTRPLTEKEKEYFFADVEVIYDCELPDDGQTVLITDKWGNVETDTFYRDDGCYFEDNCDEDDVVAWMPLPESYKAESEE